MIKLKSKIGDIVTFKINNTIKKGMIVMIDENGTLTSDEPSYDLLCHEDNTVYKHVPINDCNYYLKCPIIKNRIINDITFATRLNNFLKDIKVNDMASEQEKTYLLTIAKQLLNYQKETISGENEKNYFFNIL